MPSATKLTAMQSILDKYAVGKMNFSKQRITDPVEQGGLGLFNIQNFLAAMQAGWVVKAGVSCRDN
jgi:UDP-N-acetylmuramyl tripeptide synthase